MSERDVWLDAFTAIRAERLPSGGANLWERADPVGDEQERWLLIGYADADACLAVAQAIAGDGYKLVEAERLARLVEYVAADLAYTAMPCEAESDTVDAVYERYAAARAALQSGDLDAPAALAVTGADGEGDGDA